MIPFAIGLKINSLSFWYAFDKNDRLPYMVFQHRRGISMLLLTFSLYESNSSQQISTMILKRVKNKLNVIYSILNKRKIILLENSLLRIWNILESFTILFLMLLSYIPDSSVMSSGKQNIPLEWRTSNKVLVFFSFSKQKYAHEKQCLLLNRSITYESLSPP